MSPAPHHYNAGLSDAPIGGSARSQPAHNSFRRQSNLFEPGAYIGGLISRFAAKTSLRRKLAGLRPRPFFSRPHANNFAHVLLTRLSKSATRNSDFDTDGMTCRTKSLTEKSCQMLS